METAQEVFEQTKLTYNGEDKTLNKSQDVYDFLKNAYNEKPVDATIQLLCEICVTLIKTNQKERSLLSERNLKKLSFGRSAAYIPSNRVQKVLNINRKIK